MNYTNLNKESVAGIDVEHLPVVGDFGAFPHMWRAPFGSARLYFDAGGFYSGLTGPIGRTEDQSHLNQAAIRLAYQGRSSEFEWRERADYGTVVHLLIGLHESKELIFSFDDDVWKGVVADFIEHGHYHDYAQRWYEDVQNDMAAYFNWKADYNVRVLSVELMVKHRKVATPLDLIVEMDFNKKRIFANVNIKTGDHGFQDSYYKQVWMEAQLFNKTEGRPFDLTGTFAWRPKDRKRTIAGYELSENCINEFEPKWFDYICDTVELQEMWKPTGKVKRYTGGEGDHKVETLTPDEWLAIFLQNKLHSNAGTD